MINQEVNRPILQVDDVVHNTISFGGHSTTRLRINLKNTGKSTAILDSWNVNILPEAFKSCDPIELDPKKSVESGQQKLDVISGLVTPLIQDLDVTKCEAVERISLVLLVTVNYRDIAGGRLYSQNFMEGTELKFRDAHKPTSK